MFVVNVQVCVELVQHVRVKRNRQRKEKKKAGTLKEVGDRVGDPGGLQGLRNVDVAAVLQFLVTLLATSI